MRLHETEAPRTSVILPCFNAAAYISDALSRLGRQTISDIEILVVDDGSTDETADLVRQAAKVDARVRLIQFDANRGVAAARREGVCSARAPWIWMVDADDLWPENAIESLLAASDDADVIIGAARYVYKDRRPRPIPTPTVRSMSGRDALAGLLVGQVKGHLWNKLFKRELLARVSFRVSRVHSDLSIVAEALATASRVQTTESMVYDYRVRSGSIITSRTQRAQSLAIVADVVAEAVARYPGDAQMVRNHQYFEHRFILLSALKDAANPAYGSVEKSMLLTCVRQRLRWSAVAEFARGGEVKRALATAGAKLSAPTASLTARLLFER